MKTYLKGVLRRPRVLNDDGGCLPLFHREFVVHGANLIVHDQRHQGRDELGHQLGVQLRLRELLGLDHLPGGQAED